MNLRKKIFSSIVLCLILGTSNVYATENSSSEVLEVGGITEGQQAIDNIERSFEVKTPEECIDISQIHEMPVNPELDDVTVFDINDAKVSLMPVSGYEHAYDSDYWSTYTKYANCYAYMLNVYSEKNHKLQPGELAGSPVTRCTKEDIIAGVKKDMSYLDKSIRTSTYSEKPGVREYKVALVIDPLGLDYHWYRQDSNAYWSHKRGLKAISNVDASQDTIPDPKTCDRDYGLFSNDYSEWCGYYIISY